MPVTKIDHRIARLEEAGTGVLRYGVVFLLAVIGATKFTPWEAAAIEPLVTHSPFLSWLPKVLGLQGASNLIGAIEIATALAIAARRLSPAISAVGSLAGAGTFLTTLSFLFTTPGALSPMHPASGFLMKDIVLLGACLATAAEAARAARVRAATATMIARAQPACGRRTRVPSDSSPRAGAGRAPRRVDGSLRPIRGS
jgi:reactive chlorine resistance protein C